MTATQPAPDPEQRLIALGLELPPAPAPLAAYVPARRAGNLVFVSGQIPMKDGSLIAQGVVPTEVDPETAVRCAQQCTLNGLAALKAEIGTLSRLRRVVRLGCFVASAAGYHEQPKIANGASELLIEVFGEAGRHARAAVGSVDLPLGAPVEIEFVFEVQ
ncbi:MAG: RidA family protein [Planctomycetes bacterium]|nr:RidA family protein [Planctomycetota bacterium]